MSSRVLRPRTSRGRTGGKDEQAPPAGKSNVPAAQKGRKKKATPPVATVPATEKSMIPATKKGHKKSTVLPPTGHVADAIHIHRCGRKNKKNRPCRARVAAPGEACYYHRGGGDWQDILNLRLDHNLRNASDPDDAAMRAKGVWNVRYLLRKVERDAEQQKQDSMHLARLRHGGPRAEAARKHIRAAIVHHLKTNEHREVDAVF